MIVEKDHGTTLLSDLDIKNMSDREIKEVIAKLESDGKIISINNIKEFQKDVFCPDERTMFFKTKNIEDND